MDSASQIFTFPIHFSSIGVRFLYCQNVYLTDDTVVNCSFCHCSRFLGDPVKCIHFPQSDYDAYFGSMEEYTINASEALQPRDNDLFPTSLRNDLHRYDARNPELAELDNVHAVEISSLTEVRVEVDKEALKISGFVQQICNTIPVSRSEGRNYCDEDSNEPADDTMKNIESSVEGECMGSGPDIDNDAANQGSPLIQPRKAIRASRKHRLVPGGSDRVLRSMKASRKALTFE